MLSCIFMLASLYNHVCVFLWLCVAHYDIHPASRYSGVSVTASNESLNAACSFRCLSVPLSHHAVIS